MTPIPVPRCPSCGSHLTLVPEGRQESETKPWLTNVVPFVSCDGCGMIYDGTDWHGTGIGQELTKRATAHARRMLHPRVSKLVNQLRGLANQIERADGSPSRNVRTRLNAVCRVLRQDMQLPH